MSVPEYHKYVAAATEAARAAGALQLEAQHVPVEISFKSSFNDLVTQYDPKCEAVIREVLLAAFPEHTILGEEDGEQAGRDTAHRWHVDPIDGTTNFAHGFPFYCVSIALEERGELVVGVIYDAVRDELFTATKGGGAFLNGQPLTVSARTELRQALVGSAFYYSEDAETVLNPEIERLLPHIRSLRRTGSAALDLAYVAAGRLDAFWEVRLNSWDIAAGSLLIREAGGTVTNRFGEPQQLAGPSIVASNGHIHATLLATLGDYSVA